MTFPARAVRLLTMTSAALLLAAGCSGDKNSSDTMDTPMTATTSAPATAEPSAMMSTAPPPVIDYGEDGISMRDPSEVNKLTGAPLDFKQFIEGVLDEVIGGADPDGTCIPTVGVNIIDTAGFAAGGISGCDGASVIWAKRGGKWGELWSGQTPPPCDQMKAAHAPKNIVDIAGGGCFDKAKNDVVPYP